MPPIMWDLGSPTRGGTVTPCIGSMVPQPLDPKGSPHSVFFNREKIIKLFSKLGIPSGILLAVLFDNSRPFLDLHLHFLLPCSEHFSPLLHGCSSDLTSSESSWCARLYAGPVLRANSINDISLIFVPLCLAQYLIVTTPVLQMGKLRFWLAKLNVFDSCGCTWMKASSGCL